MSSPPNSNTLPDTLRYLIIVVASFILLQALLVVMHELTHSTVAYILMRPFASHGDTGLFNRGLALSPWFLFILGGSALVLGLFVFYRDILPRAEALLPVAIGRPNGRFWRCRPLSSFFGAAACA